MRLLLLPVLLLSSCALFSSEEEGAPQVNAKVAALTKWLSSELTRVELWTGENPNEHTQAVIDGARVVLEKLGSGELEDVPTALNILRNLETPYRSYLSARGYNEADAQRQIDKIGALLNAVELLLAVVEEPTP